MIILEDTVHGWRQQASRDGTQSQESTSSRILWCACRSTSGCRITLVCGLGWLAATLGIYSSRLVATTDSFIQGQEQGLREENA
jgi:hypothetical protein